MKKALIKDSVKEIKNTYKRFLSILLMAFLGVGFFAGLKASSPDMVDTIDNFYYKQNVYDIEVISTLGLTNEDLVELENIEGVSKAYGNYSKDVILNIENTESVAKLISQDNVNQVILKDGKIPENTNECLVEESLLIRTGKKIGDTIQINETDDNKMIKQNEMQIVGTMKSPLYISRDKGTSKLGSGKVDYLIFCNKDNFDSDIYTEIYITVKEKIKTSTKEYEDYIEKIKNRIENIKEERQKVRYDTLLNEATEKLNTAQNEFDTEKAEAEKKIKDAEEKIKNGKDEINKNESTIKTNREKANKEFARAQEQITLAKQQLNISEKEFEQKKQEAEKEFAIAQSTKKELQTNLDTVNNNISKLQIQYNQIIQSINNQNITEEEKEKLEQQKLIIEENLKALQTNRATLENGISQIETKINEGEKQLQNAQKQLSVVKQEIQTNERKLQQNKNTTYEQLDIAQRKISTAKEELQEAESQLATNKKEFEDKIQDAETKLIDAKQKISEIESPKWYILDRTANISYNSYIQDTENVTNIATVFPIVFFIVATLISLTSMTRMVEEQRVQIGTLKALGYNKLQIASKYLIYASLACIIGGISGMCIGFILLPNVVWMMYSMMYTIDEFIINFNTLYGSIGIGLISICIIGATSITVLRELKYNPSELMRPKAPKMGKRVLLEKIPFIWKRLSFSRKVTIRNIFRYKKRFLMTIFGICGCTALILTGFGIKDSISRILEDQYERINKYDMQIILKTSLDEDQKEKFVKELKDNTQIENIVEVYSMSGSLLNNRKQEDVQIIIPKNKEEISEAINILDIKSKGNVELQDGQVYITQKVAELLDVKAGDSITLKDNDDNMKSVEIGSIVENYISHYVYMTRNTYEKLYKEEKSNNGESIGEICNLYETNSIYVINKQGIDNQQIDNMAKQILLKGEVASITRTDTISGLMSDMMGSLNYVVVILIISAGLLAFVVLYNLANVNMSERIRELATIKVLGFYDKEVYSYVTRETVLLTFIGIILGLIGGYFLNSFVLGTCELNILKFSTQINVTSYIYSILITWGFTMVVNVVTYFALKKINMIESLKSVE